MKITKSLLKSNKNLLVFMALSYFDKAIIFLLPILVLFFFNDKSVYLSIEYIYSITIVVIPLLDLGLSGYFFFAYRNRENKNQTIKDFVSIFHSLYLILTLIGVTLIAFNYFAFEFEKFIVFIVSRILFVLSTTFLASYYRLTNRPEKVLYISIFSNILSLLFVFAYFFSDSEFSLWLIFIGQILFCLYYFFISSKAIFFNLSSSLLHNDKKGLILKALLFSWPTILQVFITMYITNYGKINALSKMTVDDGVLLSIIQRLSMIIFLTHSSLWAYLIKDVYVDGDLLSINKKILFKYIGFLFVALLMVSFFAILYLTFSFDGANSNRAIIITCLIIAQTFFACILAYIELHYSRENKNIIALYLALFGAIVFISILTFLEVDFLLRVSIAMFISTFASFLLSVFVLNRRNYKII